MKDVAWIVGMMKRLPCLQLQIPRHPDVGIVLPKSDYRGYGI